MNFPFLLMCVFFLFVSCSGFSLTAPAMSAHPLILTRRAHTSLRMGNTAKFGIFSPAVFAAKLILGESKLNKVSSILYWLATDKFWLGLALQIRGKVISLHSQAITQWCVQYGAYHLRTRLVSKCAYCLHWYNFDILIVQLNKNRFRKQRKPVTVSGFLFSLIPLRCHNTARHC